MRGGLDDRREVHRVERLRDVSLEARVEESAAIRLAAVRGERDRGDVADGLATSAQLPEQRQAVLARHRDVAHDDVGAPRDGDGERLAGRLRDPSDVQYSNFDYLRPILIPAKSPLGGEVVIWR